jgi:hypothetical protein
MRQSVERVRMATVPEQSTSGIRYLDDDESHAYFDHEARRLMNMSGPEFIRRFDAGEFDMDGPQHRQLVQLVMMLPFGR